MSNPFQAPTAPPAVPLAPAARRRDQVVVGLGIALLSVTVMISVIKTRWEGDIDASNLIIGLLATAVLLAVAVGSGLLLRDHELKAALVGWPGAFGAVALGAEVAVWMDDKSATAWVVGLLVLAVSVGCYLLAPQGALTLTAVLGLAILYAKAFDAVFDPDGDNGLIWFGAAVLVFTAIVTAATWFTPYRTVVGVTVGAIAAVAYSVALIFMAVYAFFASAFFGSFSSSFSDDDFGDGALSSDLMSPKDPLQELHNDVWTLLVFSAILIAMWAVCGYLTGHAGYRLIQIGLAAVIVPASMIILGSEHPTWWGVVFLVLGAVPLALVALWTFGSRGGPSAGQAYPGPYPGGYPAGDATTMQQPVVPAPMEVPPAPQWAEPSSETPADPPTNP